MKVIKPYANFSIHSIIQYHLGYIIFDPYFLKYIISIFLIKFYNFT